ncbi:hypothetical protein M568_00640 [Salmonella enterica subsp. enterica serovar Namur str. 05-2929]|nr:hypothetical protein M568_00640 [Salmonella enterica subsp. enterica serovar Namur str. 05-2929]
MNRSLFKINILPCHIAYFTSTAPCPKSHTQDIFYRRRAG